MRFVALQGSVTHSSDTIAIFHYYYKFECGKWVYRHVVHMISAEIYWYKAKSKGLWENLPACFL